MDVAGSSCDGREVHLDVLRIVAFDNLHAGPSRALPMFEETHPAER